jgi:parvulin-like peptidyl-prolyl isomerase
MQLNRLKNIAIILASSLILAACGSQEDPYDWVHEDDVVLVEVGGEPVTKAMLEVTMEARGVSEDETDRMRELLDGLIRLQAVANAARDQGAIETAKMRAERRINDLRLTNVRFLDQFQTQNPVTDADIARVYREQVERAGDRRFRIEAVQFNDQVAALEALESVSSGERDFSAMAAEAQSQGLQVLRPNWIDASQVPATFADALASAAPGEVLATPQAMGQAWVAARLIETEMLEPPPLEDVREGIRRTLASQRSEALVESLFEDAVIVPMLPMDAAASEGGAEAEAEEEG